MNMKKISLKPSDIFNYFIKPHPVTTYLPPCLLAAAGGLLYNLPFIDSDDD